MTSTTNIQHIATISELHANLQLAKSSHPLISLINLNRVDFRKFENELLFSYGFYTISLKRGIQHKIRYGRKNYDFDEGILALVKPHQVMGMQFYPDEEITGWLLAFHPDFLSGHHLSEQINKYGFFSYGVDEALHLSEQEERQLLNLMQNIDEEYTVRIDAFSQAIMVSQIYLLLSHINRFYHRQFLTRKKHSSEALEKLDIYLENYFDSGLAYSNGLPKVHQLADHLSTTSDYLNDLIKSLTGCSTRDYIHRAMIQQAKLSLSLTTRSISEVGYELGFQHSQSFNKFFKKHTHLSPGDFRKSLN